MLPPDPLLLPPLLQERVKQAKIPTSHQNFFMSSGLLKNFIGDSIDFFKANQYNSLWGKTCEPGEPPLKRIP
jgi:hypothetical protein